MFSGTIARTKVDDLCKHLATPAHVDAAILRLHQIAPGPFTSSSRGRCRPT